jgi:hypothetical protein
VLAGPSSTRGRSAPSGPHGCGTHPASRNIIVEKTEMKTTFVMKNYAARFLGDLLNRSVQDAQRQLRVNKYIAPLKYLKTVEKKQC